MIITRCPYRVSFFGGGTDFPEWYKHKKTNIITCSINAFCYITIRKLLPFYGNNYRISWSEIEQVNDIESINHPAIKWALKYLNIDTGLEIHTDGDLPARSGIGSSSSFSAALILALFHLKGEDPTTRELTEKTIYFEQEVLKENVGIQDQIQTCHGGFNLLSINNQGKYRILRLDTGSSLVSKISENLFLLYTGITRNSSEIQSSKLKVNESVRYNSLENIAKIADKVTERILKEDITFDQFSGYLNESWEEKSKLFIQSESNDHIHSIYNQALNAGAKSGKLLGAGGGGFFLFFVEKENQQTFREKMRSYTVVKHSITNSPCTLLFNSMLNE